MQLKTVGESLSALTTINNVLEPISHLESVPEDTYDIITKELCTSLNGYSAEAVKAAIAQTTLDEAQIKSILSSKGLEGQLLETSVKELSQVTNINKIAASEKNAMSVTESFGNSMAGLGSTIKKFVTTHPILTAITAVTAAFHIIGRIADSFFESSDEISNKLKKNVEKTTSSYSNISSQLENINSELEANKRLIDELNNKDKLTYVENEELRRLKTVNDYLERQQNILKEAKLAAAQEASDAIYEEFETDFYTNKTKTYKDLKNQDNKFVQIVLTTAKHIPGIGKKLVDDIAIESLNYDTDSDIFDDAIKNYKQYKKELDTLVNSSENYSADEYNSLKNQIDKYSDIIDSYKTNISLTLNDIFDVDPNLETDGAKAILDLLDHIDAVMNPDDFTNNMIDTLKDSDDFYQAGQNIGKKFEEGLLSKENLLSDKDASKFVNEAATRLFEAENNISLDAGTTFKEAVENTKKRLMQEIHENPLKAYSYKKFEFLYKMEESDYDDILNKTGSYIINNLRETESAVKSIKSFEEVWHSEDFSSTKDKLSDLAKAGTISAETIKSTKDYQSLLDDTGLTAEQVTHKIIDLLSVHERLSAATEGLKSLENAYREFKDNDTGFVTASTLEGLSDVFKTLKTYDFHLFEEIVGNPESGVDKIQQAFNDITTAYLVEQGTMNGLIGASEAEIHSYIANLKQIGITNAEEIVTNAYNSLKENNRLLSDAESEYIKYLNHKEGYDIDYINSTLSKSGQLVSKLGDAYQNDYTNWCELLQKKTAAYNQFVETINSSQNTDKNMLSVPGAGGEALARRIISESEGKIPNDQILLNNYSNLPNSNISGISTLRNTIYASNGKDVSVYTSTEIEAARELIEAIEQYKEYHLKLTQASLDLSSGFNYVPLSSDNASSADSLETSEPSKETFDWIERKIQNLTDALNNLKDASDDTYSSWTDRSNALRNAVNTTRQAIDLQH